MGYEEDMETRKYTKIRNMKCPRYFSIIHNRIYHWCSSNEKLLSRRSSGMFSVNVLESRLTVNSIGIVLACFPTQVWHTRNQDKGLCFQSLRNFFNSYVIWSYCYWNFLFNSLVFHVKGSVRGWYSLHRKQKYVPAAQLVE